MALKPRYKRRIFWSVLSLITAIIIGIIIIPPMIHLNDLKPRIEQTILEQTGINAKIEGDVNFSLLGKTTIVANDVIIPMGTIGSVMFSIPFNGLFNLDKASFDKKITIYDASLNVNNLGTENFAQEIEIHNSDIEFMNKKFFIIEGLLTSGRFIGAIRTNSHKYELSFDKDEFVIKNNNEKLYITGKLYSNGSASGHISTITNNIPVWFKLPQVSVKEGIEVNSDFEWNGDKEIKFTNIESENFSGDLEILQNGQKNIKISAKNVAYDFSFLLNPGMLLKNAYFDLDFYGDIKFANKVFHHIKINAFEKDSKLTINNIIADDIAINGGYIDENGAVDVMITMPYKDEVLSCLFSGNPTNWKCSDFSYGDIYGSLSVEGDTFNVFMQSEKTMPSKSKLRDYVKNLGSKGIVNFQFSDISGTFSVAPNSVKPTYKFAKNRNLLWLNPDLKILPKTMLEEKGEFYWQDDKLKFVPNSKNWVLVLSKGKFELSGNSAKSWLPKIDLRAINDFEYNVSGNFDKGNISNLVIKIAGQEFIGGLVDNNMNLKTKLLNLDSFISQNYLDNYEEMSFLTNAPVLTLFEIPVNLSLQANSIIYNGDEYKNFVYALNQGTQTFSISDSEKGNLLGTIKKDTNNYDIFFQLNKFKTNGLILSTEMPLNVKDSTITADIKLQTFGNIAHDIVYNLSGNLDLTFTGGKFIGLDIDKLYASANDLTSFNIEYALSNALSGGESDLKKLHITGEYKDGNFITTDPLSLSLRHTDITGNIEIIDKKMTSTLNITLRATSSTPTPIELKIEESGKRNFSLSEIMNVFDLGYFKNFIKTHEKF